ncbi:MAG: M50 family metallopeptidase [Nostocaceae cyanobacterium]|nr:M50 family metallopeptidase [Nostocaceae cyanobacterium]
MSLRPDDVQPSWQTQAPAAVDRMGLAWLTTAAIATIVLWQVPGGDYILYPFTILATWFHEMGHGLAALLLGGWFEKLMIFPNGSGVAFHTGSLFLGPIGRAVVAAAGPMGPPLAGAGLILASRRFKTAHWSLLALGSLLIISTVIWVRSTFGLAAIPLLGLLILGVALKTPRWMQGFTIQFLGVQACVSTYHQVDYLFTPSAGPGLLSDTGQIEQQLFLPFWFWGTLMAIASLVILAQSLRIAYRSQR